MYKDDENFEKPPENALIWRYLDFPKLVDMLARKSLFFATVENLRKSDVYEGSLLDIEADVYERSYKSYADDPDPYQRLTGYKLYKEDTEFQVIINRTSVVNCWHMNDIESAAMWKLYAPNGAGIAICSTFGRLRNSIQSLPIPDHQEDKQIPLLVRIGVVSYVDFQIDRPASRHFFERIMRKSKFYDYERELRAVASVETLANWTKRTPALEQLEAQLQEDGGLRVPVDLDKLIERIVMAPKTPKWMQSLINNVVVKYGLSEDLVELSAIAEAR